MDKFHRINDSWNLSQSELLENDIDLCYNYYNRDRC